MNRRQFHRMTWRTPAVMMMVAAWAIGCEPEIEQRDPPGDRVEGVFDAEAQVVPMPNDAAMDDGSLPAIPGAEPGTAAGELDDYMSSLDGWPRTTPIEIPFSGPLDEESINDQSVRLYQIEDDELSAAGVGQLRYREADHGSTIEVIPQQPLQTGQQYAAVATRDLLDAEGQPVLASLVSYLAASKTPLVDEDGEPNQQVLADDPEQARQLEQMRQSLKPVFESLEQGVGDEQPIERDDVAVAYRWTTMSQTAAAFYPDFQQVPLPNTAALDADGTFPESATCHAGEESAQGALDDYLAGLSGWPAETPITITLTGPVSEETIGDDDIQLWKKAGGEFERDEAVTVEIRDFDVDRCSGEQFDSHVVELMPSEPMSTHEEYFAVVTRDAAAADEDDDAQLLPELPMWLALQPHALVDGDGASTVSSLSDDQAAELEAMRQMTAPLVQLLEETQELAYGDLAAVWSWYTWDDTFVQFDPQTQQVPFPNSALMDDDEESMQLVGADEETPRQAMFEALNERAGFSTTAGGWIPLDGELDEESFDGVSGVNFLSGISVMSDSALDMQWDRETERIVFDPTSPLDEDGEFVGVVSNDMTGANGRPIQPSPFIALLRNEYPVAEDGESLVDMLSDEEAVELEENRADFDSRVPALGPIVFDDWGDDDGTDRYDIVAVWTFETEDPVEPMLQRRAMVRDEMEQEGQLQAQRACEAEPGGCGNDPHLEMPGDEIDHPGGTVSASAEHLWAVHRGVQFDAVYADDAGEQVGLTVYLPDVDEDGQDCQAPYHLVVTAHNLGADRHQAGLAVADEMAAAGCLATVAVDLPHHGGRTPGADSLHPEGTPDDSGEAFFGEDPAQIKQNLTDAVSDLFAVARLAQSEDDDVSGFDDVFDELDIDGPVVGDVVGFAGTGLGAVVGVAFAALEPSVQLGAFNSAGGQLGSLVLGDDDGPGEWFEPVVAMLENEDLLDGTLGGADHFETAVYTQWLLDYVDPYVFAELAGDVDSMVQMAEGERTVLNASTQALADRLGADLDETSFDDAPHGFLEILDPGADGFDEGECARMQVGAWFSTGLFDDAYLPDELSAEQCL